MEPGNKSTGVDYGPSTRERSMECGYGRAQHSPLPFVRKSAKVQTNEA